MGIKVCRIIWGSFFFLFFLLIPLSLSPRATDTWRRDIAHVLSGWDPLIIKSYSLNELIRWSKNSCGTSVSFPLQSLFPHGDGLWMSERPPRGVLCSGWGGELSDFISIFFSLLIVGVGPTRWGICPAVGFVWSKRKKKSLKVRFRCGALGLWLGPKKKTNKTKQN